MDIDLNLREMAKDDYRFIIHSWARSFSVSRVISKLHMNEWLACKSYAAILEQRLPAMSGIIACNPEDETQIFGYLVFDDHESAATIHFVYVKDYLRNNGIGSLLSCTLIEKSINSSYPEYGFLKQVLKKEISFKPFHLLGIVINDPKEKRETYAHSPQISGTVPRH